MFELETISDDEIDYFRELKNQSFEESLLNFISEFDTDCKTNILYPVNPENKVTANIATQPQRFERLLRMLESIDGQFDEIRIYLNNFRYVPKELSKYTTYIGEDLTDNGKFFWSNNSNEYYFTLDDDIIYPSDYVQKTLPLVGDRIVSYHGRILTGIKRGYYDKHKVYMYHDSLKRERRLDVMGTGVSAFDTNFFKPNLWKTPNYKMTDLVISLEAHINEISIISPIKSKNWLFFDDFSTDGIYFNMKEFTDKLSNWSDMIYSISGSNIDLLALNYQYGDDFIKSINLYIDKIEIEKFDFINIRTGNGHLSDKISNLTKFREIYSFDTDKNRVDKCINLYSANRVQYKHVDLYSDCDINKKDCFVFCDDYMISNKISTQIFNSMKIGSHLICYNCVNGILPDGKIKFTINDKEVTFFYYLKK